MWIDIGSVDQFPAGSKNCLSVQGRAVVVCHVDGRLVVVSNICPHAGRPLGEGELRGRVLTCPYHGYAYDVITGRHVDFPYDERPVKTFPVRCTAEGRVEVQIPSP